MKTPEPALLLSRGDIAELLTLDECILAVENAFRAYANGQALMPGLLHVSTPRGEFHVKVGGVSSPNRIYFTTKVGGGFFANRAELDLPTIIGLILLADGTTGSPLAVMESSFITRLRTGAATAVAAKYLARQCPTTVTVCGAGAQAEVQLLCLARVLTLKRVFIWARNDTTPLARRMSEAMNVDVQSVSELGCATLQSDVILTCTPAKRWYLGREHVKRGTFVAAVGADSPNKQEIEPELLKQSSVVCDLIDQSERVGDLHHALTAGLMTRDDIRGELGEIIIGAKPPRLQSDEIIIFDSTGTALQDAAVAAVVYEKAMRQRRGQHFAFWN
jgi:alanine dehydrogenase